MLDFAILSRDAAHYHQRLTPVLDGLKLALCQATSDWHPALAQAQIILADPDLIAPHLHRCGALRWLQSTWAGNAPLVDANHPFVLTGVKGVFGDDMAEYVLHWLLHLYRRVPTILGQNAQRQWQTVPYKPLRDQRLAIFGVGSIGRVVAERARQFGMHTLGLSHSSRECEHIQEYISLPDDLDKLGRVDALVNLLPDTPHTRGLINAALLAALPPHAVLINAGRGSVLDEAALMQALNQARLGAAVLDVFSNEPLPANHPFWQTPNLIVTHHSAAISNPDDVADVFASNLQRFTRNQQLAFIISASRGY